MHDLKIEYKGFTLNADGNQAQALWQVITNNLTATKQIVKIAQQPQAKAKKPKHRKSFNHATAKLWTQEEFDALVLRSDQLKAGGVKIRTKRAEILAKEFTDRSFVAIHAKLGDHDTGKGFYPKQTKGSWKRIQHEPEPEQEPQKEYLTANPNGEIEL